MEFKDWLKINRANGSRFDSAVTIVEAELIAMTREAYVAGWNACRDRWGGLNYDQTLEFKNDGI